ncbi:hypothetical protein B0T24DRAFT_614184 [Lasiosphaeria ovina]|uniref:DUF202 domain-containing protein n=1 Tax=Lasiosphaeria ovina TaxID=92902 RepID=A0AAE0TTS2_9PEZI|nr:hypothetical protein B0T24DRAFT_614184 [Lasiosphaeria ovina]
MPRPTARHYGQEAAVDDEEDGWCSAACCAPLIKEARRPIEVGDMGGSRIGQKAFYLWPLCAPLLFDNESSDCRDHCANERTFLSYLRLSIYMSIVSVAIILSFHLRKAATDTELRMAKPLGAVFWLLSVSCLGVGVANYIKTVNKYGRRAAIVQHGWKTQTVMAVVALSIVGACVTLLVLNKLDEQADT